jgi:hypothetical protein
LDLACIGAYEGGLGEVDKAAKMFHVHRVTQVEEVARMAARCADA